MLCAVGVAGLASLGTVALHKFFAFAVHARGVGIDDRGMALLTALADLALSNFFAGRLRKHRRYRILSHKDKQYDGECGNNS